MTSRDRAEEARLTHEVTKRALRRLDLLEWVAALVLAATVGLAFRPTWVVASALLFAVPAAIAVLRMRRDEREIRAKVEEITKENDG